MEHPGNKERSTPLSNVHPFPVRNEPEPVEETEEEHQELLDAARRLEEEGG